MCERDVPEPRNGGETDRWLFLQLISSVDQLTHFGDKPVLLGTPELFEGESTPGARELRNLNKHRNADPKGIKNDHGWADELGIRS